MPESLVLAPPAPFETIPTYRLIDVLRCIEQRPAAIKEALSGKVVLIGSNLPEEDRNAPRTGSCGSLPPRRARAPIATHAIGTREQWLKAQPGGVDFVITDPPYITRYADRSGRSVANDDNARLLKPAFAQMHRVFEIRRLLHQLLRLEQGRFVH